MGCWRSLSRSPSPCLEGTNEKGEAGGLPWLWALGDVPGPAGAALFEVLWARLLNVLGESEGRIDGLLDSLIWVMHFLSLR